MEFWPRSSARLSWERGSCSSDETVISTISWGRGDRLHTASFSLSRSLLFPDSVACPPQSLPAAAGLHFSLILQPHYCGTKQHGYPSPSSPHPPHHLLPPNRASSASFKHLVIIKTAVGIINQWRIGCTKGEFLWFVTLCFELLHKRAIYLRGFSRFKRTCSAKSRLPRTGFKGVYWMMTAGEVTRTHRSRTAL